jgi:general stress protein YciG
MSLALFFMGRDIERDLPMEPTTRLGGFASMDRGKQREIARKGGMAAHRKGTAHEFTAEEARFAGRKGGQQVASNRGHMIEIGRLGGRRSAERRKNRATANIEPVRIDISPQAPQVDADASADSAMRQPDGDSDQPRQHGAISG